MKNDESSENILDQILNDYKSADINSKEKAMLDYAVKLTKNPAAVNEGDINKLREFGLNDRDILDVNQVVSYFNYVNRVADGLGIELEPEYI